MTHLRVMILDVLRTRNVLPLAAIVSGQVPYRPWARAENNATIAIAIYDSLACDDPRCT